MGHADPVPDKPREDIATTEQCSTVEFVFNEETNLLAAELTTSEVPPQLGMESIRAVLKKSNFQDFEYEPFQQTAQLSPAFEFLPVHVFVLTPLHQAS